MIIEEPRREQVDDVRANPNLISVRRLTEFSSNMLVGVVWAIVELGAYFQAAK